MSHYTVMIVGPDPEAQLAPFEEREGNEQSRWDWYLLGGRWTGYLRLKEGAESGKLGKPGLMTEPASDGRADQARMRDIDWPTMRRERELGMEEAWADFEKEMAKPGVDPSNDHARQLAAMKAGIFPAPDGTDEESRKKFLALAGSPHTYAVLMNGKWISQGDMGWFGMSSDAMTEEQWAERFDALLGEIDPDDLVSIYDLHI